MGMQIKKTLDNLPKLSKKSSSSLSGEYYIMVKTKDKIKLFGIGMLYATTLTFIAAFIIAYFNSGKTVLISINQIGEANIEMWIVMPMVLIFGTLSLIIEIYDLKKKIDREIVK